MTAVPAFVCMAARSCVIYEPRHGKHGIPNGAHRNEPYHRTLVIEITEMWHTRAEEKHKT